ncbi:hypothetical protein OBJ95_06120 [Empedobacter falsenii]
MPWIEINNINDLPKIRGKYHVCTNGKYSGEFYFFNTNYRKKEMLKFSHWCIIEIPKGPNE